MTLLPTSAGVQPSLVSWSALRRHARLISVIVLASVLAAGVYLSFRTPTFTASSRILVDNRILSLAQTDAIYSVSSLTSQLLDSQVEILRSADIARHVILEKNLLPELDPALKGADHSKVGADDPALWRALQVFQKRLAVERVGQSYVIEIRTRFRDPSTASSAANAVVDAYLEDQRASNEGVAQAASGWLRSRLQSLGTTARVLSRATPPLDKDGPNATFVLAFAVFAGVFSGLGVALGHEMVDRRIRTTAAVKRASTVDCFGIIADEDTPNNSFARRGFGNDLAAVRGTALPVMRQILQMFFGRAPRPGVLGVLSPFPGGDGAFLAVGLAALAAGEGKTVLVIDASVEGDRLIDAIPPPYQPSPARLALGETEVDFVTTDAAASEAFLGQNKWDIIIVHMPPLSPAVGAQLLAAHTDAIVLAVKWRTCTEQQLQSALSQAALARSKYLGAVLTNVSLRGLYESSHFPGPYRSFAACFKQTTPVPPADHGVSSGMTHTTSDVRQGETADA